MPLRKGRDGCVSHMGQSQLCRGARRLKPATEVMGKLNKAGVRLASPASSRVAREYFAPGRERTRARLTCGTISAAFRLAARTLYFDFV